MTLTRDASTPAVKLSAFLGTQTASLASNSFTPPAGSIIVVTSWAGDSFQNDWDVSKPTISNSGSALSWNLISSQFNNGLTNTSVRTTSWWAFTAAAPGSMTATVAEGTQAGQTLQFMAVAVDVWTGALTSGPIGATAFSNATTGNTRTVAITPTALGSALVMAGGNWTNASTVPITAGTGCFLLDDANQSVCALAAGEIWLGSGSSTPTLTTSLVSVNLIATSSSATFAWSVVAYEVLPALAASAPVQRYAPGWHPGRGLPGLPGGTPFYAPHPDAGTPANLTPAAESPSSAAVAPAPATAVTVNAGIPAAAAAANPPAPAAGATPPAAASAAVALPPATTHTATAAAAASAAVAPAPVAAVTVNAGVAVVGAAANAPVPAPAATPPAAIVAAAALAPSITSTATPGVAAAAAAANAATVAITVNATVAVVNGVALQPTISTSSNVNAPAAVAPAAAAALPPVPAVTVNAGVAVVGAAAPAPSVAVTVKAAVASAAAAAPAPARPATVTPPAAAVAAAALADASVTVTIHAAVSIIAAAAPAAAGLPGGQTFPGSVTLSNQLAQTVAITDALTQTVTITQAAAGVTVIQITAQTVVITQVAATVTIGNSI